MTREEIDSFLVRCRTILPDAKYYRVSILCSKTGQHEGHVYTCWVGFDDAKRLIERRRPDIVNPDWCVKNWTVHGRPYLVANNAEEMAVFLALGGNALVEKKIGESIIPDVLSESVCAPDGKAGFRSLKTLPESVRNRVPSPKLRMEVMKRDGRKCRLCGRQPEAHLDLELHVHHVRPSGIGGLTETRNLITICSTCHRGLEPHFESGLFDYLTDVRADDDAGYEDIIRYRESLRAISNELIAK